jgi:putative hydrolase of HD superfamily
VSTAHDDSAAGTAALLFEAGTLRNLPRTGWSYDGIRNAETVAEHSHRASVIAMALAAMEGADPSRTAALCVIHDLHEARTGDLTPLTRRYVTATADPLQVTADQTAGAHPAVQDAFASAVMEFESGSTLEARCAKDADKLDCLLRAVEYRAQGHDAVQAKIDRCREALATESARSIADAAKRMDPTAWQRVGVPAAAGN